MLNVAALPRPTQGMHNAGTDTQDYPVSVVRHPSRTGGEVLHNDLQDRKEPSLNPYCDSKRESSRHSGSGACHARPCRSGHLVDPGVLEIVRRIYRRLSAWVSNHRNGRFPVQCGHCASLTELTLNSGFDQIGHYGKAGHETHGMGAGSVMTVAFELKGKASSHSMAARISSSTRRSLPDHLRDAGRDRLFLEQAVGRRPGKPVRLAQG